MNSASLRRPLACLKHSLRQARQQRLAAPRFMATEAAATTTTTSTPGSGSGSGPAPPGAALPPHTYFGIRKGRQTNSFRTGFAVYTPPDLSRPPTTDPMAAFDKQQISAMDPTGARSRLFDRHSPDSVKVGDVLMVTTRRAAEPFSGVCITIRRSGIETAVLLRTALTKVGVEMWFKVYSRNVVAIDIVQRRPKRARRARLTYMRQPKHDRGSVEQIVAAWRKSRNVLRTRAAAQAAAAKKASAKSKKK
ncbi:hypothetical protein RB601_003173 [Gaeumannomyces tritici]